MQDNFVSYTMQAAEQANMDRIAEQKSRSEILKPLEPLVSGLVKGFIDDADLSHKLSTLFRVFSLYYILPGSGSCAGVPHTVNSHCQHRF
jgi:hypothetical protein